MNTTTFNLPGCKEHLTHDQIEQFRADGYLALSGVLTPEEVTECCEAFRRITLELTKGPRRITQDRAIFRQDGGRTMLQFEKGFDPEGKSEEEIELSIRKYMAFVQEDPVFQQILRPGGPLLRLVESVLGAEPILFQEMALVKPPFIGCEKPWHQDNAYFTVTPLDRVLGVWIALDDATVENGCMHVIPGGHREGVFRHHHDKDCEINPALLPTERQVPVPIPAGGAMIFYGMLPHQTPPNSSPHRRRALQFHFRGAETQMVESELYDTLFADANGMPGSCAAARKRGI